MWRRVHELLLSISYYPNFIYIDADSLGTHIDLTEDANLILSSEYK
ncbi:MAG: hypothetical protein ACOC2Q_00970 [Spirochaetota bacterium]